MKCSRCNDDFPEHQIDCHHEHPKFMDNTKGIGSQINLCKKCHNRIHLIIPSIIWKYINDDKKEDCIKEVMRLSLINENTNI